MKFQNHTVLRRVKGRLAPLLAASVFPCLTMMVAGNGALALGAPPGQSEAFVPDPGIPADQAEPETFAPRGEVASQTVRPSVPLRPVEPAPMARSGAVVFEDINPDMSSLDPSDPDGASGGRCNGLASVAGDNQTFYTASEWGGLYKSTDGGVTWDHLSGQMPMVTWDVEVDPGTTSTVYATSFHDGRVNSIAGIQVSYDAGLSWTHPATSVPNDPADEGTASDNTPQAGYSCSAARRTEPSAFGISIRSDAPQNVYIGTNCGLAISNDSGATWRFVDPNTTPGAAGNVWDVVVQPGGPTNQGIIDICGDNGHFRSTDDGGTWTGGSAQLPGGRCSIAASPDESYVLFVAAADNFIYESDDAGANWTNIGSPDIRVQGRIPFVQTNQRSDLPGPVDRFDLWFSDVSLFQGTCISQNAQGGPQRCSQTYTGICAGFCDDGTTVCSQNSQCQGIGSGNCNVTNTQCLNNAQCAGIGPQQCAVGARPIPYTVPAGWDGPFTRCRDTDGNGCAHDDGGDIVFDTQAANDACPMLYTSDGGVYYNTDTGADCHDPDWEQPNRTPHALWLFGMDGVDQPGDAAEDLYFGLQDNGTFVSQDVGAASPTWFNRNCCDSFDFVADASRVVFTVCCGFSFNFANPGLTGAMNVATNPPGNIASFRFVDFIDQFGDNQYIAVTTGGSGGGFITSDITANPVVWTQLGAASTPAGGFCGVHASVSGGGVPTFYAETFCVGGNNGIVETFGSGQLWKFTGTNPAGTWQRIDNNDGLTGGFAIVGVDPRNPNRIIASNFAPGGPQMVRSTDGGMTWDTMPQLDNLMQGGGVFQYQTQRGPTPGPRFNGYAQPTFVAFDPEDPNIVAAGARDAGVFVSRNGGARWALLTDPFDSANSGIPHLPRPWFAYFDHEPADSETVQIYVGTQGRGVWRLTVPLEGPVITVPNDVQFADTCVGESSKAKLNVCNTGGGKVNLVIEGITSSDPQFEVTEPSSGYPVAISPDFCFPFEAVFTPTDTTAKAAILTITSNDPGEPTVEVHATGEGIEPNIASIIANNGNFGDVCLGDFKDLDVTISNSGNCALTVDDITSTSTEFDTPSVVTFPLVIGPKDSLAVPIRFEPSGAFGPRSETITIHSDDPDTPERDVAVSGNVPPGDIRVTGSTDFGQVCAEDLDSAQMPVSICNVGKCNLNVSMAGIKNCTDGDGINDFELVKNPFPAKVSPDFCIDLMVRFTPSSCGPKTCELNIMSDDPDSPVVTQVLTGNTPCASIDVPPDVCFPPTVIQAIDNCESLEPFPVSNTSKCNLTITNFAITDNPEEFFLEALPSFPILLEKGHIAGEGDLSVGFAPVVLEPELLQREHLGEVSVTYVSDPVTGDTMTETRSLCGESVRTGARVLVMHNGVPLDEVKGIRLLRINANRNRTRLDTVDVARNLPLQTVTRSADCACPDFQFHREYGTVDNPIQLLPGSYEVSVMVRIDGKMRRQTAGFRVGTCGFNPNIVVDF